MALYGGQRDISLFRHVNRELIGNIISQQCAYYKFKIDETKSLKKLKIYFLDNQSFTWSEDIIASEKV